MKAHLRFLLAIFLFSSASYGQCVLPTPYTENFDGTAWGIPSGNQSGTIPSSCWSRVPSSTNFLWAPGPAQQLNTFTGPLSDHTSGNGKFIFTLTSGFVNPVPPAVITTPQIDLSSTTNPEVSFWYHMFGSGITSLSLEVNNGSGWTNLVTKTGSIQTSNTDAWQKETVSLTSYAGDTITLRFVGVKTFFSNTLTRMAVDDLTVQEAPTCTPPTAVFTTNTTANSTQIGWQVGSASSTSWEIEYGPVGFTPGNGTIVTATTNPYTLTGLSGSTTYAIYVREVCSPTDKSPWEGPAITNTPCSSALQAPYTENFDALTWVPYVSFQNQGSLGNCWIKNPSTGFDYQWLVNPNPLGSFNTGPSADNTTGNGKYVATQFSGTSTSAVLRSPSINLSGVSNPELKFYYHMYGAAIDKLEVDAKPAVGGSWTTLTTITGQQQTTSTDAWLSLSLSLSAYANQTIFIRFRAFRSGFGNQAKIAIDDLSILPGSSCPTPNGLAVNNITATSASATWNTITGAQYEVKYGAPSFDPNTAGTSIATSTSPTIITSLTPGTAYDVYVRRLCTNDSSNWDGPISFSTGCIDVAPYLEDFESSSWTVPPSFPQTLGNIDACWNRSLFNTYFWAPGPEQFPSFQTGPQNDHTTGSGKFMFTHSQSFGGTGTLNADLETPSIDLSPLNTPELTFWYHMYGSQIGSLIVQINTGSGWTNLTTITGAQQTSKTDAWEEEIINLSTYANDTIKLRFRGTKASNAFNAEIAIDDVDIHELPSCPKPQNLAASNVTFNSVSINWTTGGASNWVIKYGAPGFSPAAGTYTSVNSNPYTITGLTQNTQYEIWVRDSCGTNDVSDWNGPIIIRTACSPQAAPYTENFDGNTFQTIDVFDLNGDIDNCFSRSDTTDYYWGPGPASFNSFQTGPDADHTSGNGKYMYTRTGAFLNTSTLTNFVTPWIDASSLTLPQLRFWYHMYGTNITSLIVRARRYDGSQQIVSTITGQQQTSSPAAWLEEIVNLNNFVGDTVRFIFTATTNGLGFRSEISIDDISLNVPQNCADPTNLSTANATTTSIDLSWNSAVSSVASNIEYGPAGFTQGGGSGTIIYGVTSPYTVNNLTPNTLYDFYVIDSCSWGGLSNWVGPETDSTLNCLPVGAAYTFTSTGLSVSFDATSSTGNPSNFTWDFGDGNTGTGSTATNNYAIGGIYNVTLIVENGCGSSDTLVQSISLCEPISASFTTVASLLDVSFDGSASTGTNLTYQWIFGDGTTGSGMTTTHTYPNTSVYGVGLIVTDACGNVDTALQNVIVCDSLNPQILLSRNGFVCDFSLSDTVGIINYNWNFGDGNTGLGSSPTHTYANTGTYNVSVTVTNICGQQATATYLLTLCILPKASWTYTIISSSSSGMTVQFDGSSSIGANTFLWEFGDGATNNTSSIPTHTYSTAGLFWVVKLTVENSCGDTDFLLSSLASIGLDDLNKDDVKTFPNPVDDELVLIIPEYLSVGAMQLVDMAGKVIEMDKTTNGIETKLSTQNLPEGAYVLRVSTDAGDITFNLVVRH